MKDEPLILAIETAVAGSLSILKGSNEIASLMGDAKVSRSEDLLKMISEIFDNHHLKLKDVDLISVSLGPGSFTGVRVGLATAKALAFGLNLPGVGIPVFEALALGANISDKPVVFIIPAGRSRIFWQCFYPNEFKAKDNYLPRVGSFKDLLEEIELAGLMCVSIITESRLYKENQILFKRAAAKISSGITVQGASDNICKFIAQAALRFYKQKDGRYDDDSFSRMVPQYILGKDSEYISEYIKK